MAEAMVVVCVVETSLALAAEWPHVLADYLAPLLHRLGETHTGISFRIGFVSYATADNRPTPIFSKIFFSPPQTITKTMGEQPQELGIGQTGSGGGQGMAALEGLVAAMEMFETLKTSIEKAEVACHLIHIASTPPDGAERPLWNVLPSLDFVTWATMPAELRKRGIHYSNILLKKILRLSELQTSAAVGAAQTPWFTVRSPHVIQITGFPQKGTKRSGTASASPEITKRAKIQPPASPLKSPAIIAAAPPPAPPAVPPSSSPSVPTLTSILGGPHDPARRAMFQEKLQQAEVTLRTQAEQCQKLEKEGRVEAAKQLRITIHQRAEKLKQVRLALSQGQQAQVSMIGQPPVGPSAQPPPASSVVAKPPDPPQSSAASEPSVKSEAVLGRISAPSAAQPVPNAPGKPVAPPIGPSPIPPHVPPEMAAQMQKLIEQKNRLPLQHPPTQPTASSSAAPDIKPMMNHIVTWTGTLSWRGFDSETHIRKDVYTRVVVQGPAKGANGINLLPEAWPTALSLAPSQHPAVSGDMLAQWTQAHRGNYLPLNITPNQQGPDAKANEEHFRGLIRLLIEKNVYALVAWAGLNGMVENRILIFPLKGKGTLAGAYFPLPGGVPELPKGEQPVPVQPIPAQQVPVPQMQMPAQPAPAQQKLPPSVLSFMQQMTPEQQAVFAALPQERKMMIVKNIVQKMAAAKQQQQQMQQMQQQQQQQQQMQQQQMQMQQMQMLMTSTSPQPPQPPGPGPQQQNPAMNPWTHATGPNVAAFLNQLANPAATAAAQNQNQGVPPNPGAMQNPGMGMANLGMGMGGMNMNMANVQNQNPGMNLMAAQMQQQQQQGGMKPGMVPPGMHRRTPSGNGNAQLSLDMLQSFMHRKQDGGGGANGSLGGMG